MTTSAGRTMPALSGATGWLNSEPLSPAELRGHVVLVDFWTLTCINWLRTEPYVRAWSRAYRDDGLVVIGVHTPEFSFEHDVHRIRQAIRDRAIDYAVAVDSDYAVWRAFDNHYWPALYLIDTGGTIRDRQFGEGRYEEWERAIQRLLGITRQPVPVTSAGVEAQADWDQLRTPETYLGYARGDAIASPGRMVPGQPHSYGLPDRLELNQCALAGEWTVGPENVTLGQPGGSISFRFHARDAHLVLSAETTEPIAFRVRLDGRPPGPAHGTDLDEDGNGLFDHGRLYQLVRQQGPVRERTLDITFSAAGAEAYVFTFG